MTYHKHIRRIRRLSANSEQLEQVPKLAVNITADRNGAGNGLDIALFHEDASDHLAECLDVWFW